MRILAMKNQYLPADQSRQFVYPFELTEPLERLSISFSYGPKLFSEEEPARRQIEETLRKDQPALLEDPDFDWRSFLPLQNLLTLSLDREGEYRGARHDANPNQKIVLTPDTASQGFYPGPIGPGQWRIVLSTHAVVCPCEAEIVVEAFAPGEEAALC